MRISIVNNYVNNLKKHMAGTQGPASATMDHIVDHSKYFQDPTGAVVALSGVWELLPTADHRVHLAMHRLGWQGNALWHRTEENRIAEFSATVGVVDADHAICLCRIWLRRAPLVDAAIDVMLGEFIERVRNRLGEQAILGSVFETSGGDAHDEPLQQRSYGFRADFGSRLHRAVPVRPGSESRPHAYPGYIPMPAPEVLDNGAQPASGPSTAECAAAARRHADAC